MARQTVTNPPQEFTPSVEDINSVADAAADMYHQMVALYRLLILEIPADFENSENIVAAKGVAQLCAQRLDVCVTKLTGEKTGLYEDEFGL
ncbi:MAG: hypothetical protein K2Y31_14260 [Burkholderiales bacterium]|jgi:hypothetical protein|nr:hypothetical protein [Burkholderiales bacterium]